MAENTNQSNQTKADTRIYHFSRRMFTLSILFLIVNLGFFAVVILGQTTPDFAEVDPAIRYAGENDVQIKNQYDDTYKTALSGDPLYSNSSVKTGADSFIEIRVENNIVRVDENTEIKLIENNFGSDVLPRLEFELVAGNIWINAFDKIAISTPRSVAVFHHSVGVFSYSNPLNVVMSIMGNVDLKLLSKNGNVLTDFIVPLKTRITFADPQIIPEYARLEHTKLKKELKASAISSDILSEPWVLRNTRDEAKLFVENRKYIFSENTYNYRSKIIDLKNKVTLLPFQKRALALENIDLNLKYLLGAVYKDENKDKAKSLLRKNGNLAEIVGQTEELLELYENQFYAIRNVKFESPAYLAKESLRKYLYNKSNPELLRTYLADFDYLLRTESYKDAVKVSDEWKDHWSDTTQEKHQDEFVKQTRIYRSIVLAYSDVVPMSFVHISDDIAEFRLDPESPSEKIALELTMDRIDNGKYLVVSERYPEARSYITSSLDELRAIYGSSAASDLFAKESQLLLDRINFEESKLKGAADSEEFEDYLSQQEIDKVLTERYLEAVQQEIIVEEPLDLPTVSDLVDRFSEFELILYEDDVFINPEFPVEFNIITSKLVQRASDGSAISFSGDYDYSANALYSIILNGEELTGNYALSDFVIVALAESSPEEAEEVVTEDGSLLDFLNLTESNETESAQVIAIDLALQLLMKELSQYQIYFNLNQVEILDKVTFTEYELTNIVVDSPDKTRRLSINFVYSNAIKSASEITVQDYTVELPEQVLIQELITVVYNAVVEAEAIANSTNQVISDFSEMGLILKPIDMAFVDEDFNEMTFTKAVSDLMPIEISGTYFRKSQLFGRLESEFLTEERPIFDDFMEQTSREFVISYLAKKGVTVYHDNISSDLPSSRVRISDYVRGSKNYNFVYDVVNNRLRDIEVIGTSIGVESMSFDEFALIDGGEEAANEAYQKELTTSQEPEEETETGYTDVESKSGYSDIEVSIETPEDPEEESEKEEAPEEPESEPEAEEILTQGMVDQFFIDFYPALYNCDKARMILGFGTPVIFDVNITTILEDDCVLNYKAIENPIPNFLNTEMECLVPKGEYVQSTFDSFFDQNFISICSGSYLDALGSL